MVITAAILAALVLLAVVIATNHELMLKFYLLAIHQVGRAPDPQEKITTYPLL